MQEITLSTVKVILLFHLIVVCVGQKSTELSKPNDNVEVDAPLKIVRVELDYTLLNVSNNTKNSDNQEFSAKNDETITKKIVRRKRAVRKEATHQKRNYRYNPVLVG